MNVSPCRNEAMEGRISRRSLVLMMSLAMAVAATVTVVALAPADGQSVADEDREGWMSYVDYYVGTGDVVEEIQTNLLNDLAGAENRIDAAIAEIDDGPIVQALVDAADRGVAVRVVADELFADHDGFAPLVDHDDIDVVFGDGELAYLPEPNLSPILEYCDSEATEHDDHITCAQARGGLPENNPRVIVRPAHYNVMSHTFFIIDTVDVWNISAPLNDEQPLWVAFRVLSEEIANSYEREFRQMHGGVFSTTLSVYNGPLKSVTHQNPLRWTNRGNLRIRFNPQERLTKNIIDETYRARASVYVMTENLTNTNLIDALLYKKEAGFDVRVLVGQGQATTLEDRIAPLEPRVATEDMGRLPTMVIFDSRRDRNGNRQARQVQVLSHELMRAQPFEVLRASPSDRVRFYPSDTFADGVLWEILESGSQRNPEIDAFLDAFNEQWSQAQ